MTHDSVAYRFPEGNFYRKMVMFLKQLNLYLNHFPSHEKFGLALGIRNDAYVIFDLMVEGQKRHYKKTSLTELDVAVERLRMKLLLAYELGYFSYKTKSDTVVTCAMLSEKRYGVLSLQLDEIGRIVGGWIKKVKEELKW
ncbi:MAG: four helix bundle protein [Sulfuricurvum sp.]|uniref:four helix bundle protein n=1 Tax=Sulfuricurvum sp. TaxID=2025608 RepID=UPI002621C2BB|nr:four helix bundle protein [Sulfuricurvum sp.]MDD5159698.1 four helix bundle protein [Sulfuricurvum sp.]